MLGEGNGNDEIEPETSSISSMSNDGDAASLRRPVADAQMVDNSNASIHAACSSCGLGMPMTPGLPPMTPDLIPVPPPSDLFKLIGSLFVMVNFWFVFAVHLFVHNDIV